MKTSLALEIGDQYLKALVGKSLGAGRQVFENIVKPIAGLGDKEIANTLAVLLRELKARPQTVVVSIPRNQMTLRNLRLPSHDKKEINQMLELSIRRIVPYKREEIIFDYSLCGADEMNYSKVILSIVHKDILKRNLKIVEDAGLFIDRIHLSSYAAWGWALANLKHEISPTDIYLLLDIDSAFTDFIIFTREALLFSRSITLESKPQGFSLTEITKLIGEVKQSLVIFHNEEVNRNPAKIFLGGAHAAEDLSKAVEAEFENPVKCVPSIYSTQLIAAKKEDMPRNVSMSAVAHLVSEEHPKNINFVLPEIQIRKTLKERTRDLTILGSLVIYFLMLMLISFFGRLHVEQGYLKMLRDRAQVLGADTQDILNKSQKVDFIKDILSSRQASLCFILELQKLVPEQIAINFLNLDNVLKVTLRGQGQQLSDVFKLITTLENSAYFKDITTRYTRARKVKDTEITEFELIFQLVPAGKAGKERK